jgi:glycosyltransferase involved in cell wall biosynthesis
LKAKSRIGFFKTGDFSHINASVLDILQQHFPESEIETVDVKGLISRWDLAALFSCFRLYGWSIITGRKTFSDAVRRTPYYFRKIRSVLRKKQAGKNYRFTFQTQSLYDLSLPGTPHFVYTDHTHLANLGYPAFDPSRLYARSWVRCEKEIYQHAALVFTMSTNIASSVCNDYTCDPEKVKKVYCGANVTAYRDEQYNEQRYAAKNILFTGVDWERKGGPALVEAFQKVRVVHPDATLTIVGCGPRVFIPGVAVKGWLPPEKVKTFFEKASLFCFPTRIEPFGVVMLEAMAHKLPVVASNIGAIPDFIQDGQNGFLVEPDQADQLAEKIIRLLDSPGLCNQFGENGHQLFWERYNWAESGRHIKNHIDYVLG